MLMTPASKSSKKNMLKGSHTESMRTLASPTDLAAAGAHRGPSPARRSAAGSLHPQEAKKTYGPYGRLGPWAQNSKQKNEEKKNMQKHLVLFVIVFVFAQLSVTWPKTQKHQLSGGRSLKLQPLHSDPLSPKASLAVTRSPKSQSSSSRRSSARVRRRQLQELP